MFILPVHLKILVSEILFLILSVFVDFLQNLRKAFPFGTEHWLRRGREEKSQSLFYADISESRKQVIHVLYWGEVTIAVSVDS